jgi:hypothetical protein
MMVSVDYERSLWWKHHLKFVASIRSVPFFHNDGKPLKSWKLFETRDAAWDAAWDAVRDAAWDAVRDAARDAAFYTRVVNICSGLKLDVKFIAHARARWQVWQKGYGLLCDVKGVLYVYKRVR